MSDSAEGAYSDDMISQFLIFSGSADSEVAKMYLEMSGGDLETAVGLFIEHQNSGPVTAASSLPGLQTAGEGATSTRRSRNSRNRNFSSGRPDWVDEDGVRAPDQSQRMRLLDFDGAQDDDDDDYSMPPNRLAEMLMQSQVAMMQGRFPSEFIPGAFASDGALTSFDTIQNLTQRAAMAGSDNMPNMASSTFPRNPMSFSGRYHDEDDDVQILDQHDDDDSEDDEVQEEGPSPPATAVPGPQRLSDMFAAPASLMYMGPGGFQGARNTAKDSKRWLLVNLQRDSDFACHALNRDVWRDELVDNLIREGFIFWQAFNTSPEGMIYAERYKVTSYPHVAIIDPRTGRLILRREGWTQMNPLTAADFSELAADFCSRHSFENPPLAPNLPPSTNRPGKRSVNEMTEEEQLEAALQASIDDNDSHVQTQDSEVKDKDRVQDIVFAKSVDEALNNSSDENTKSAESSWETEIARLEVGDEPMVTEGVARIMFRMPDGKRLMRKFYLADPVKKVYGYVAQSNDDASKGKPFELKAGFPPKDLISSIDQTIENAGLSGDTVTVRWRSL